MQPAKSAAAPSSMADWLERCRTHHEAAVKAGLHDAACEYDVDTGFLLCHCSKRRREQRGLTKPPGPLIHQAPLCPQCHSEVDHDGDTWVCHDCCCHWDQHGEQAEFTDVYGNLEPCVEHGKRCCWRCSP